MCLNPLRLPNNRCDYYPQVHAPIKYVQCNNCAECRALKQQDYQTRIIAESFSTIQNGGKVLFLTFTHNDASLPIINYFGQKQSAFNQEYVTAFLRAIHRHYDKKGLKFKHIWCCEYGKNTKRPHYHCMFFLPSDIDDVQFAELCRRHWTCLHVDGRYVNVGFMFPSVHDVKSGLHLSRSVDGTSKYLSKYVTKDVAFYSLPIINDIAHSPMLREKYKNFLPKLRISANFGICLMPYVKYAHDTFTDPCTLKVTCIPQYCINKKCYNIYRCDELNADGQRKVVRELTDFGRIYKKWQFEKRIKETTDKFYNYASNLCLNYSKVYCYELAVYHCLYRCMLKDQFNNFAIVSPSNMFDYDIVCQMYDILNTAKPWHYHYGTEYSKMQKSLFVGFLFPKLHQDCVQLIDVINQLKSADYVKRQTDYDNYMRLRYYQCPEVVQ